MKKYKFLKHTADLAIKGYGKNLSELFLNISEGMYEVMVGEKRLKIKGERLKVKNFKIEGETQEDLLVNFLNELVFQAETNRQIFLNLEISKIKKGSLEFSTVPSPLPLEKLEIKAATYHNLKITKIKKHYQATVVFDI